MKAEDLQAELERLLSKVRDGVDTQVLKLNCNVTIELRDEAGNVKDFRELHNLICTTGKNEVLKATGATYVNQFAYCAIGTGSVAAAITDTALGTEVARSAVITPTNPTAPVLQFSTTFAAGTGTGAITESGLFQTAVSGGIILARQVFSAVNKAAGDAMTIVWQLS